MQAAADNQSNTPQPAVPTQNSAASSPTGLSAQESWQEKERDYQRRRAEAQLKANNDQAKAQEQIQRCNYARQQLGVLKEPVRVYKRDDNGERRYVVPERKPLFSKNPLLIFCAGPEVLLVYAPAPRGFSDSMPLGRPFYGVRDERFL